MDEIRRRLRITNLEARFELREIEAEALIRENQIVVNFPQKGRKLSNAEMLWPPNGPPLKQSWTECASRFPSWLDINGRVNSVEALLSTPGDGSCRPRPVAICHPLRKDGKILPWPHIAPCRDHRICA
jgi:hypothetical protein